MNLGRAVVKQANPPHKGTIVSGPLANMADISRPQLCIVGAGALGIALAQHARTLGARVVLVDRGMVEPGDGPQRSLQVASIAASAAQVWAMRNGSRLGLNSVDPKVNMKGIEERARQVAADRAPLDSRDRLKALGIEVVAGTPHFIDAATLAVGETNIRAQAFVLALGGADAAPAIPGLEEAGFFTSDSLLDNTRKLTHLLVIGSDPEGLALAQAYRRLGSAVTVVPQGPALPGFDIETASILMQALADEGLRILDGASLRSVQPRSQGIGAVVALADGSEVSLDLSHILVANGRSAGLDTLSTEQARLRPVKGQGGRFATGPLGQTSNRVIRVVGPAAGMDQWHKALAHGRSVVEALILGGPRGRQVDQPRLVGTEPALAQIGRFPANPAKLAPGHQILRANLAENDMARVRDQAAGLIKVLVDPKGRILSASVVGPGASDLAGVLSLFINGVQDLDDLARTPLPQPSFLSSLRDLGENQLAGRRVSSLVKYRGALKRLLRL